MLIQVHLSQQFLLTIQVDNDWVQDGQAAEIRTERLVIGNRLDDEVQIAIGEETVSQPHGEFFVRDGQLVYRDLGSRYGSFLLEGLREIAYLHAIGRRTEFAFPPEEFGKALTFQVGQIGMVLKVTQRPSEP
ncbi:MAG: hypothetical protein NZT92_22010 [Abditibacteriales bacterium]|nr:hypothetical protein [Abditibacteriales bacterium]